MKINIDLSIGGNHLIYLIGFILAIGFSIFWIIQRRKKRKREQHKSNYSAVQIFGIVGILLFLLPIFFLVISNLLRGILFISFLIFRFLHFPDILVNVLMYILLPVSFFIMIIGTYLICEFIWPQKTIKDCITNEWTRREETRRLSLKFVAHGRSSARWLLAALTDNQW